MAEARTLTEQHVKIAADLYECRRAARWLLGDRYAATIEPYRRILAAECERTGDVVLVTARKIGETIPLADPIPLMMLMAAAVELMESGKDLADG